MSVFNTALDMSRVDWQDMFVSVDQVNVNDGHKDEKAAMMAEARTNSEIKKYAQLDLLLYEHVVGLFHHQAPAYGISCCSRLLGARRNSLH